MTKVYYAVYDKAAEIYSQPFLEIKDGTAIRAVQDTVKCKQYHKQALQTQHHRKVI